jgi:uncharacterized protein (UPF0333 family)
MCDRLEEWRTAMDLLTDNGISVKSVAEATGIPETTVYSYSAQSKGAVLNVTAIIEHQAANGAPYVLASMCRKAGGLYVPILRLPGNTLPEALEQGQNAVNAAYSAAKDFFAALADGEVTDTEFDELTATIVEAQSNLESLKQIANAKRQQPAANYLRPLVLCDVRR